MSDCWVQMPLSALAFALQLASSEEDRVPKQAVPPRPGLSGEVPDLEQLTQEFVRDEMVTHPSRLRAA